MVMTDHANAFSRIEKFANNSEIENLQNKDHVSRRVDFSSPDILKIRKFSSEH